ncbi:MAG: trimeric intracellular cation channel family protein [Cyanobacteria bacterium J069]|nr:MAG: trimeric intracellular cation channel family protein [Cyanobacteria bacterium J069]
MIAARKKGLDLVGIYAIAFVNAFGGGTLRDVLLDRRPFFWVRYEGYAVLVLLLSALYLYGSRHLAPIRAPASRVFALVDAFGLALFSISGTAFALEYRMPLFTASLLGVITGVVGGVLRDILLTQIPVVFRKTATLYATCAFVGCWVYLGLVVGQVDVAIATVTGFSTVVVLRMLALRYNLTLPTPLEEE